jgi:large subunit ribosomal protein L15
MMLDQILAEAGAHKRRKRVGRGESSGHGRQSGRGNKGCQARAGGGTRPLHEGGQMPIFRRLPKRGFSNFEFRREYQVVNLGSLETDFENGETANIETLRQKGLVAGATPLVKILGKGTLSKKLTVEAHAFSASAKEAIEKAGGTVKPIERTDPAVAAKAKRNSAKRAKAEAGDPAAKS